MKLTKTPSHCAGCFQQRPEARHIDFEAAYDGPVIPGTPEPVPVDDLILCEKCLESAFALLDPQGQQAEIERLTSALEIAYEDNAAKDRMTQRLTQTVEELVEHPIQKQGGGTQHFAGLDPEIRRMLAARKRKRNKMRELGKKGGAAKQEKEKANA